MDAARIPRRASRPNTLVLIRVIALRISDVGQRAGFITELARTTAR